MALTNYLTATVLVLAISGMVGDSDRWPVGGVAAVAAAVLLVQWMWSVVWLRRYHQGQVEWLWRWVTWWQRPGTVVKAAFGVLLATGLALEVAVVLSRHLAWPGR